MGLSMRKNDLSKRRFLKFIAGLGFLLPGLSIWFSSSDFRISWHRIHQNILFNVAPQRNPDAAPRKEGDATILYREHDGKDLVKINDTAVQIWNMCDGKNSIQDIAAGLSSRFDVPLKQSAKDVADVITAFIKYGLVKI
jgi:hypothetical protein